MSPGLLLSVAAGGAIGAVGRFVVMNAAGHWLGHGFPNGTFIVNILGSFLLGAFLEISALAWSPSAEVRAFIVVGFLGAFTTFSTFSMDTYFLLQKGNPLPIVLYVVGSVVAGVLAFVLGMVVFRHILG